MLYMKTSVFVYNITSLTWCDTPEDFTALRISDHTTWHLCSNKWGLMPCVVVNNNTMLYLLFGFTDQNLWPGFSPIVKVRDKLSSNESVRHWDNKFVSKAVSGTYNPCLFNPIPCLKIYCIIMELDQFI